MFKNMNRFFLIFIIVAVLVIELLVLVRGLDADKKTLYGKTRERSSGPSARIVKTIHGVKRFKKNRIHPDRFILSKAKERPFAPVIYDLKEWKQITLPSLEKLPGLPPMPSIKYGKGYRERRLKMILQKKFWKWGTKEIVHYDAERGRAGIYLEKEGTEKTLPGNPPCKGSGKESKFIEKYQRYYCYDTRKYVDTGDYLKDYSIPYYAVLDLGSGRVKKIYQLSTEGFSNNEQDGIHPVGVSPDGRYFYYSNRVFFYKLKKTTGHILLYKFDTVEGRNVWKYRIRVPVRYKGRTAASYSIKYYASPDLAQIVFWEYDERKSGTAGWLRNPSARAYIVDTKDRSHFTVNAPLTPYGHIIGWGGRYLLMGSNQTGMIHRIDLRKKKEERKIKSSQSIFFMALSSSSRYLYVFTRNHVEVRNWPDLKFVKRIPLSKIFPGINKLLVSERMITLNRGKYAVIGILKKKKSGPWASSDLKDGFHILELGD
jgi:hypothetical protein